MTKNIFILTSFLLLLLASCSSSDKTYELRISENTFEFLPDGGIADLTIYFGNDWSIENREEAWCNVSPKEGKRTITEEGEGENVIVRITVSANPTTKPRNSIVIVKSGDESLTFVITQEAASEE